MNNNTNIGVVATLGPASSGKRELNKMLKTGFDIARLNFSHGTHEEHIKVISTIRALNKTNKKKIKIMQDLEGYRIRIGNLKQPMRLKRGTKVFLTNKNVIGSDKLIPFSYNQDLTSLKKDTWIHIDDGKIQLKVLKSGKSKIEAMVVVGGKLRENKGVNIPEVETDFDVLTAKDRDDVKIAIKYKLDYVAQSFVRSAKDIRLLRNIIKDEHPKCKIIAKVENRQALKNIDEIISESDGIIVARGDLGISVPIYKVPMLQKEIVKKCLKRKKPVVVATQMLDSMAKEIIPTRAEVTDVANAVLDGANYLMLSVETAVGKHPAEVVSMMNKIITYTKDYKKTFFMRFDYR
jgi:pyruvate kinase